MVDIFHPTVNEVYFIDGYTLMLVQSGTGMIQVDFKNYDNWEEKALYLSKGQYVRFLSDDFSVMRITFPNEVVFRSNDFRVLFKHLVALGYIDLSDCKKCRAFLGQSVFSEHLGEILDISVDQWFWQNPFRAQREEYELIFDLKEMIDSEYHLGLNEQQLVSRLSANGIQLQRLVNDKLGISVGRMLSAQRITESQRNIAFSDDNIQEIAFKSGFSDPSNFNRAFKRKTGQTPRQFRENFDYAQRESFVEDLLDLLKDHHRQEHQVGFYADQMHLSVQALSQKVRDQLNTSLGKLIRFEIIQSAKSLLDDPEVPVAEVADQLGFGEPQHFSAFFKKQTGLTPSAFRSGG